MTTDETCITIMINDQFIALPMKEAARVYERLGDLLNAEQRFPEGKLFNVGDRADDIPEK